MLVHRWGILRKPIPMGISVKKTTRLVLAMCKLHNFCISSDDITLESILSQDVGNIVSNGGIYLPRMDANTLQRRLDLILMSICLCYRAGKSFINT